MDRDETIGLGAAVGGHALLLIAFAFGLLMAKDRIVEPPVMEVTLMGEDEAAGAAPAAEEESEPAPEAATKETEIAEPVAEPVPDPALEKAKVEAETAAAEAAQKQKAVAAAQEEARRAEELARRNNDAAAARKAAEARQRAEAAKRAKAEADRKAAEQAARERAAQKKAAKDQAIRDKAAREKAARDKAARDKAAREKAARDAAEREKRRKALEEVIKDTGDGRAFNQAVATKAKATIGNQIRISGCPNGVDVEQIVTTVTINLSDDGSIASLSNISQRGQTPSNAAQMKPTERCILSSIRAVRRFSGLNPDDYASWKSIRIGFKTE